MRLCPNCGKKVISWRSSLAASLVQKIQCPECKATLRCGYSWHRWIATFPLGIFFVTLSFLPTIGRFYELLGLLLAVAAGALLHAYAADLQVANSQTRGIQ